MKSSILRMVIVALVMVLAFTALGTPPAVVASTQVSSQNQISPEGSNSWTKRGPTFNWASGEAPEIGALLYDRTNSNYVFAGSNQGVYFSSDGGENWQSRSRGLGGYGDLVITKIAQDPVSPDTFYISTWGYGLFKSTNEGVDWVRVADPLAASAVEMKLLEEGGSEAPVVRAGGVSDTFGLPSYPPGQDKSTIQPRVAPEPLEPLEAEGMPLGLSWTPVRHISINPGNANELFASISNSYGVYRSPDGGASWTEIGLGQGESGSGYFYIFAPSNNQIRYTSIGGRLYKSTNGGASWSPYFTDFGDYVVFSAAIHPTNPDIVIAATWGNGLWRTDNGGSSWTLVESNYAYYHSVAFSPSNPNVVYAGNDLWVYISENTGVSWVNADNTYIAYSVWTIAIHPTLPETVLVGNNYFPLGGVYKRTSKASPFALKYSGMIDTFVLDIEQDPLASNILYAGTWGGGSFRSNDSGVTWAAINALPANAGSAVPYIYALEAVPDGGGGVVLYAATFYSDWGILRSTDRGATWTMVSDATYASVISFDLEAMGNNPNYLVAATFDGMEYSYDGGASWYHAGGLTNGAVLGLCEWGTSGNYLAATYGGGLFFSSGGTYWYEANTGATNPYTYDVACSADSPGLAYAGSLGVFRTLDYGQHWHAYGAGIPSDYIRAVDIVPGSSYQDVFASSNATGVYLMPKGHWSWTPINSGLGELRTRAIRVVGTSPNVKAFVGTNGQSAWEYSVTSWPSSKALFLPMSYRGYTRFASTSDTYENNNTLGTAYALPGPGSYNSFIWNTSDQDWYRIQTSTVGPITINLDEIPAGNDYDIELYTGSGLLVGGSWQGGNTSEKIVFQPIQNGSYYVVVYSYAGSSSTQAYRLTASYNSAYGGGDIWGTVSQSGAVQSGVPILMLYDNGFTTTRVSTLTDGAGNYHFRGMPGTPVGHTYEVIYPNYENINTRLAAWYCNLLAGYPAGMSYNMCNFSIATVNLTSPAAGATVGLPVNFQWQARSSTPYPDSYVFRLRNSDQSAYWTNPVGSASNYMMSSLPSGFYTGTQYLWDVLIDTVEGFGIPYYARYIYFSSAAMNAMPGSLPDEKNIEPRVQPGFGK